LQLQHCNNVAGFIAEHQQFTTTLSLHPNIIISGFRVIYCDLRHCIQTLAPAQMAINNSFLNMRNQYELTVFKT